MENQKSGQQGHKTKEEYRKTSDKIWNKRYNSPFVIRRYIHRTQYETVIKHVERIRPKPEFILDCGCGEGVLSVLLAERGFRVIGMDISEPNIQEAIKTAKSRNLEIDFIVGDAENMPFKDKHFDLVVASHVLEHLPNIENGFKEIKRVSNKAIISVPTCLSLSSFSILGEDTPWAVTKKTPIAFPLGFIRVIINIKQEGVIEKYAGKDEFPHPWFYPWKFKRKLEKNKFTIQEIEADTLCPPYISQIFPKTLQFFSYLDKLKTKKILNYFGYGTTFVVEVKQ